MSKIDEFHDFTHEDGLYELTTNDTIRRIVRLLADMCQYLQNSTSNHDLRHGLHDFDWEKVRDRYLKQIEHIARTVQPRK